jgi:two-component system KDP operon response regulator KdpE
MSEQKGLILIVEDDMQTRRFLKTSLSHQGWGVIEAENGRIALEKVKAEQPDLVILDLGLPDMDGIDLTRKLRFSSDLPILVLSARAQEQNKIMALDAGADDYLTKPFGTGELRARLEALLRRVSKSLGNGEIFETGDLKIDRVLRKVYVGSHEVKITPIEYRLLSILVRQAGLVVSHRELLKEVWGIEHVNDQHYLRIYMGQLRHKLEINPARPKYLLTEVGIGYRLAVF